MPYVNTAPEGANHGPSIKNPAVFEALVREGKSKAQAAAISNAALRKGQKRGRHHAARAKRRKR